MRLWHWKLRTVKGLCIIEFPTWFPLLLSAGVTAFAWRSNLLARRRARIGKCIACGYALDGLPPGAPCPECGAARTDAITQTEPADAP